MGEKSQGCREIRFCPYCFQQQFDVSEKDRGSVYCELCGIDVDVQELVKQ